MIIYVETNFIIELAFAQEEHAECRALLDLTKAQRGIELALPTFCVGEAYEVRHIVHMNSVFTSASLSLGVNLP
jgi:hypothetical protein